MQVILYDNTGTLLLKNTAQYKTTKIQKIEIKNIKPAQLLSKVKTNVLNCTNIALQHSKLALQLLHQVIYSSVHKYFTFLI